MQKLSRLAPLAFVATTSLVACSFSMRAGSGTNPQNPQQAGQPANTTAPAATPKTGPSRGKLGKRTTGPSGPTPTPSSSNTTPTPAPPPSTQVISGAITGPTPFGSGTLDPAGYKGSIYWVPAGTTKIPTLASMQPNGFLFTKEINATPQAFTGFPGLEQRKENFAIRYEAPLVVSAEADYDFRIVADDGAILLIDNTPIVDNDGVKSAPAEKTGPVHLVAGTHTITVDYLQTTGNIALQVFCKKANDTEKLCPTSL